MFRFPCVKIVISYAVFMTRPTAIALFATLLTLSLFAIASPRRSNSKPGVFDYYILSLSWSPEYCHNVATSQQCTGQRHFGFVVHGLWPQFANGEWPESCTNADGPSDAARLLDIMPSFQLIQHEWRTHGTCSGLDANGYFGLVRRVYESIHIPNRFVAPSRYIVISASELKREFERANPALRDDSLSISCNGGKYLSEIRVCLGKNLAPVPCPPRASRSCDATQLRMAPVR